ncbi:MAG: hypothetical protein ACD_65C00345G0010 [uncultured bacterium]|nr:MAG: hypothetical protein ACD_65C00345G0010 [uncultured bacterium]KKT01822.1 MAG: hypothetical protein UV80_C0008G0032 [Candidatus Peregrinibacteria bacterium GW2011_GWF2_43_17]KKT18903.1 MAG: hypothetical protein UW03_C0028G0019 [Candidatus Peregrinibacteria bacterium GW2011_GWA2_43_8]HAU39498.1 hypothetical protein [Candidatus Peregrinibacteria bacterium]
MTHHFIGWIGSFLFATCAVPQAVKTWKTKKAEDLSWLFLLFWILGELLTFSYIVTDDILIGITHYPLYVNYVFNIIIIFYLLYAKKRYK